MQAVSALSEPGLEVGGRQTQLWTAEGMGGCTRYQRHDPDPWGLGGYNEWFQNFRID